MQHSHGVQLIALEFIFYEIGNALTSLMKRGLLRKEEYSQIFEKIHLFQLF